MACLRTPSRRVSRVTETAGRTCLAASTAIAGAINAADATCRGGLRRNRLPRSACGLSQQLPRLSLVVDDDEGEYALRHLLRRPPAAPAARPGLDPHLDGGVARLHKGAVAAHLVSDRHRAKEAHGLDGNGRHPVMGMLRRETAA